MSTLTDKLPRPPPTTAPPRPRNALHEVAEAVGKVVGLPSMAVALVNEGFASATHAMAQAFPAMPAATLGSLALGLPHAHIAHPPSGPPPAPPLPLPPLGAVALGTSVQVLINGLPAARCGDLGLNPTCCGLPPVFEVFTGSSNVFIGGARAARVTDMTFHCKPVPPAGAATRGVAAALRTAMRATLAVGMAAQATSLAGDALESSTASDPAVSQALALSAGLGAAQMAADAAALAMGMAMGKDPCVPPGTLGCLMTGSPNVLIGGFPMPNLMDVAQGMMRLVKGLKARGRGLTGHQHPGRNH